MNQTVRELSVQYRSGLDGYLAGGGEAASLRSYELGRKAIGQGLGLMDLVTVHQEAVATILLRCATPNDCTRAAQAAGDFFAEALSPFEMAHRGFLEANQALRELNATLEQRVAERTAALEHQALHDTLTGLPNRTLLTDRLAQGILAARRANGSVALLVLNLDAFKEINDTLGHQRGDLLLREIGPRLQGSVRDTDTVARLGGDEFAVVLPGIDTARAGRIARKVLDSLEKPFIIDGRALDVGASVGVAVYPEHGEDAGGMLRRADTAMYAAKRSVGGFAVYADDQESDVGRLGLMGQLRHAIADAELALHYQVQVDFKTARVTSAEALLRWHHPQQGLIPPMAFIPFAERRGLIKPLTQWVLSAALRQARAWEEAGLQLPVAVNLSARNLLDPDLPDVIGRLLRRWALDPARLALEITESAIMAEPERAREVVAQLRTMGMRLSIDDFGTGYSSLAYLHRLAVDELKIDRSFVLAMPTDASAATIVRATVDLGHALGIEVVAEGVETRELWERLAALGCDRAQGYFVSRPAAAEDVERQLRESSMIFQPGREAA